MIKSFCKIILVLASCNFMCSSCNSQKVDSCSQQLKAVNDLIFYHPNIENPEYDSALTLIKQMQNCDDSIKSKVILVKFMILLAQEKFKEGANWVSSLSTEEFPYPYQKDFWYQYYIAADFEKRNNFKSRDSVYTMADAKLKKYISKNKPVDPEFNDLFTQFLDIEIIILDATSLNLELDFYIKMYPEKRNFFEFWRP